VKSAGAGAKKAAERPSRRRTIDPVVDVPERPPVDGERALGSSAPAHRRVVGRPQRRAAFLIAVVCVAFVAGTVAIGGIGGAGRSGGGAGGGSGPDGVPQPSASIPLTPPGTGIVARLPAGNDLSFSWSPDGEHLLVSDDSGSRVYDRFGRLVSEFPPVEGWLDDGHLIGGDGTVSSIFTSAPGLSPVGSGVVANGHGSAAIIVGRPGCIGDPVVDWYRDGHYVRTRESGTPFGWSPDGEEVLLGHMACGTGDSARRGWIGPVQLIDFATGKVITTIPDVRGVMSFSPGDEVLAAQTDAGLAIADVNSGGLESLPDFRFLGWLDDESIFGAEGPAIHFADLDPPEASSTVYQEWQAASSIGVQVAADITGAAQRIVAADGTTLMDLSSARLVLDRPAAADQPIVSGLQTRWWSPDGRLLALPSADGASLVLISIDPSAPARS
jgi:WD40 repeat protein